MDRAGTVTVPCSSAVSDLPSANDLASADAQQSAKVLSASPNAAFENAGVGRELCKMGLITLQQW